jgi:hypothetical protein
VRGKKAKKLRKLAYGGSAEKYGNNTEYSLTKCPGQYRHKRATTIISDDKRYFYQALKGRRYQLDP